MMMMMTMITTTLPNYFRLVLYENHEFTEFTETVNFGVRRQC